jgi:tripartite-type tricarboxylate transporter receptor subunit TctC
VARPRRCGAPCRLPRRFTGRRARAELSGPPIKLIVPYPAGGITDILPRIMGEWLTGKWGQPVIVDNRPGAAGNIGAEAAFKAD